MIFKEKKYSIFILGPDNKMLVRDAVASDDYFYFDPETKDIKWKVKILFLMTIYFLRIFIFNSSFISSLKSAYLTALIKVTSKDIAITAIDNNIHFWRAAKILHKKIRFITIQNGTKFYEHPLMASNVDEMFIPELLCYGDYDKEKLSKSPAKVKTFYPVGSLYEMKAREVSEIYKAYKGGTRKLKYDLCLISEDFTNWNSINPGLEETSGKVATFCFEYCKQNNLKMVIALKNEPSSIKGKSEIKFLGKYIDIMDPLITLSSKDTWWSSYDLALQSKVSVGMASSLLIENVSRGLKILICDFYGPPWSLGVDDSLRLGPSKQSFEDFSARISQLLMQSDVDYLSSRIEQVKYLISHNDITTEECIKSILNNSQSTYSLR